MPLHPSFLQWISESNNRGVTGQGPQRSPAVHSTDYFKANAFFLEPINVVMICEIECSINRKQEQPFMFYIHPWEIDPDQPRLPGSWASRFRRYQNLSRTESKLGRLLDTFQFGTLSDALQFRTMDDDRLVDRVVEAEL